MLPATLNLYGYQGQPVPHAFFRQTQSNGHLALILPGLGYNAHMPVLYYPTLLMLNRGADVLRVDYNYMTAEFQQLTRQEQAEQIQADVVAAYTAAVAQRSYTHLTLIGKSIGTLALGHLLSSIPNLSARCVWLTPLLRNEQLRQQIASSRQPGLFVIGSADPHYDIQLLTELEKATGGSSLIIDKADHSLEITGNVIASIKAQERIIEALENFLKR